MDADVVDSATASSERTPAERRGLIGYGRRLVARHAEQIIVAIAATVMFVVGFGGQLRRIAAPLGNGDLVLSYAFAHMWADGAPFGNSSLGYPFGMELRYFPSTDILTNGLAGLLSALTGKPFFGLNMVFAISFPVTALVALWVMRVVGLRGPVAMFISLAYTAIPYHWLRVEHVYLATMYSAALGIGLAFLIGTGRVERSLRSGRRRHALLGLIGIALVIATSGIYYACFTLLMSGAALVYRFAQGARWRGIMLSMAPVVAVGVFTGLALVPAWLYQRAHPTAGVIAGRLATESVNFSGALAYALLPAPVSKVPGFGAVNEAVNGAFVTGTTIGSAGVLWYADFGSLFTVLALALTCVGLVFAVRKRSLRAMRGDLDEPQVDGEGRVTFGFVGMLLGTAVLFFVPWGLNFLFAYAVTPQLRGWDRLIPVLFLLVFAGAAVAWQSLGLPRRGWRAGVIAVACLAVLVMDSVVPYRSFFDTAAAAGSQETAAGYAYAAALNAAVPGDCGVLELPYMGFPENPPTVNLASYAPLWPALTNPGKQWSFGGMKLTRADTWLQALDNTLDATVVEHLTSAGFCAVHVDLRGFTADDGAHEVSALTALLGQPVARGHGADWLAFALPTPASDGHAGLADFSQLPNDLQLFFAPPTILMESVPQLAAERDTFREWWWLAPEPTTFDIRATDDRAEFTEVTGQLQAAECASRSTTVELVSGDQVVSATVALEAGEKSRFSLHLDAPSTTAQLIVSSGGEGCVSGGDTRRRAVALLDPRVED
jgi:hypothetical protein